MNKKALIIFGPTASGKTDLAIKLANKFNGEIINADSRQFYKNMPIITAMPSKQEFAQAKHHLFEILEPDADFSVAEYLKLAQKTADDITNRGKLPIFVGGTGLYIKMLEDGISPIPNPPKTMLDELGKQNVSDLYKQLQALDLKMADSLQATDSQRIIRALSVIKHTSKSLLEWQSLPNQGALDYDFIHIALNPERQELYNRINTRALKMLDSGLIEEIKYLNDHYAGQKLNSLTSIGFDIFNDYFSGKILIEQAIEKFSQKQRNYAKRQLTWLNNQYNADYIFDNFNNIVNFLIKKIDQQTY